MAKQTGFLTINREVPAYRPVKERIQDFEPVCEVLNDELISLQANRCMDCGVPFCHAYGCPLGNRVPDYADALYHGNWREALELLHSTNNFPEITGRICPALCEASCTLSIHDGATTCQHIELKIAEKGWESGWITPEPAPRETGYRVAVIGSGPSGLAAAQQLGRAGHEVLVLEKADRIGGLLMYGIPNFKLEKSVLDRRLEQMRAEGVTFETEVEVGKDLSARYILKNFDAVLIASGTPQPRNLPIPGRELKGIHFALELLGQQTKLLLGDRIPAEELIEPKDKHVVVIGGGDTGSDCVGTVIRRGCKSVTQVELLPEPSSERLSWNPWPQWPQILRSSSSHEEGAKRLWSIATKEFYGTSGQVAKVGCARLDWADGASTQIRGSDFLLEADLVLLSMGFVPFADSPLVTGFNLATDERGNVAVDTDYKTSVDKVFSTGDAVTGASLVVRAIDHGRKSAASVNAYLRNNPPG
ncbi:MAG: glutamate synthase subunit beta [Spirochaetota bacterium]